MKILHVTPHYEPVFEMGGVVRSASQLCRGLVRLGADVTVFTTNNRRSNRKLDVSINQQINVGGVRVWYFPVKYFHKKFFYSPELGMACYDKIKGFDIMHLTSFWCYPGIPAGKAARKYNKPYIMSTRGTLVPYCLKQGMLKKKIYMSLFDRKNIEGASAIHYTTELEREETHQKNKLSKTSFIVPNPVPIDEVTKLPDRSEAKRFFDLPEDSVVISYVGRLNRRKALDILIEAFLKISKVLNKCFLLLAGPDAGAEARLRKLVAQNKLDNLVKFTGYVNSEKRGLVLKASDLFWYATYPGENFGHSAVEAIAAGVPVILSEYVGISRDVIKDNTGIIVSHDPEEMAKKMFELFSNNERLKQMSENAKKSVLKYDTDKIASLMLKAYEDVLTGRRSPELQWM
jgi:glycosyltransferase involved in cell wall biosynthesis